MNNFQSLFLFLLLFFLIGNSLIKGQSKSISLSLPDTTLAIKYFKLGDLLSKKAQYDSSNFYFEKAKEIYKTLSESTQIKETESLWKRILQCYNKIGWNLLLLGSYDSSSVLLNQTLEYGLGKFGEYNPEVAQSYINLAGVFWYKGDYERAQNYYQQSLSIRLKLFGENSILVADSYRGLGLISVKKGELDKALEYQQNSLSIKLRLSPTDDFNIAHCYSHIGTIYWEKGDYNRALDAYKKSLAIRIRLFGEQHPDVASSYNNIGIVYLEKGDFNKALETYQKSLSIKLKVLEKDHPNVAYTYHNMGIIYDIIGEYDKALEYYEKDLEITIKLQSEYHPDVATTYNNMGTVYWKKGNNNQALKFHEESIKIWNKTVGKDHPGIAGAYNNIGIIYKDKNDYNQALEYHEKALSLGLMLFGENHPLVADSYQHIAQVYAEKNDYTTALTFCQKSINSLVQGFNNQSVYSLPQLEGVSNELSLLNTLKLKAKIFVSISEQTGVKDTITSSDSITMAMALSTYKLSIELIDKLRTGYKAEGSKLFLGENASGVYDQAIKTSLKFHKITGEEKYRQQAFLFVEKSKSAVLQDELAEAEARQFAKLPSNLMEEEKQLRIDLSFYDTQLQNEFQKKDLQDSTKINEYQNRLFDLKARYEKLISDFEKHYPDYYDLKYQTRTTSVLEIQNEIPHNTAILDYFVGDSIIYIFIVSNKEFDVILIKKPEDFSSLIKDFYTSILKTDTKKYLSSAEELSKILIEPVLKKIESRDSIPAQSEIDKLVIIPHDILYKIPFEALLTKTSLFQKQQSIDYRNFNYLLKSFNISYHYSASLYINSLKLKYESANVERDLTKSFIGFAPVFSEDDLTGYTLASNDLAVLSDDSDELMRSAIDNRQRFNELKYSEWEVKTIIQLFTNKMEDKKSLAYFYSDATEEAFKTNVSNYQIIHVATHSFINEIHPDISGVVFAQPDPEEAGDTTVPDDGILYAGEAYNLDLNADLIVLSSCESGLGKLIKGEGLMALTRGFLYSGANNIIFSLWKIPDRHTSELMVEFYKQMLSGKNYAESLRQAKLSLINNQLTARPRSWASFILIGD